MKNKPLCYSCEWFLSAETEKKTYFKCSEGVKLDSPAIKCNVYRNKTDQSLRDMMASAWILEKQRKPGFETPVVEFKKPSPGQENEPSIAYR